jgi:hypothetical protein
MIYLDYNATIPIHPEVLEVMMPYLTSEWGNPSIQVRIEAQDGDRDGSCPSGRGKTGLNLSCPSTPDPIRSFGRNHPSYASTWVGNVSSVPGDHVEMKLPHCLPSRLAIVDSQIESVRRWQKYSLQIALRPCDPMEQTSLL